MLDGSFMQERAKKAKMVVKTEKKCSNIRLFSLEETSSTLCEKVLDAEKALFIDEFYRLKRR